MNNGKQTAAEAAKDQLFAERRERVDDFHFGRETAAVFDDMLNRERLVRSVYNGLNHNGCLILVEKVLGEDSLFNRLFIQHYYEMKRRNGYSEMEIVQKREALDNVLIPYRLEENKQLLRYDCAQMNQQRCRGK
jgi:hypothetical protein